MIRAPAVTLVLVLIVAFAFGQTPVPAVGPGSTAVVLAVRSDGSAIIAGITQGSQFGQPSQGGLDAFIAWLTPDGELDRVVQFGTEGDDRVGSIVLDELENIYVSGDTTWSSSDAMRSSVQFVMKLTRDGEKLWSNDLGGMRSYTPPAIAFDGAGHLIVAGATPSDREKDYARAGRQPFYDAYIAVLTSDGELVSKHVFAIDATQAPTDVLPLSDGTLVVLGRKSSESFTGNSPELVHGFAVHVALDGTVLNQANVTYPGDGTMPVRGFLLEGGERIAVTTGSGMGIGEPEDKPEPFRYSYYAAVGVIGLDLRPVWMKSFGKAESYGGAGIAVSLAGDLVLVGAGNGDVAGEPHGLSDVFLGAYTADGERLWLSQYGTPKFDLATSVAIASDGTIVVVGSWSGGWENIVYGLTGPVLRLGASWFIAAHAPDGEMLWMRIYSAADED